MRWRSPPPRPAEHNTINLNHGGKLDLAVGIQGNPLRNSPLWRFPGAGDGTLAFSGSLTAGSPHSPADGDLNGDRLPDLVTDDGSRAAPSVQRNDGPWSGLQGARPKPGWQSRLRS